MCRNIRTLYNFEPPATKEEIEAASLQFVRKVSGFRKPSSVNKDHFEQAVADIARVTSRLLADLQTRAVPKNREIERRKAQARNRKRFGSRPQDRITTTER